ncbi:MAG: transglutaminase family protein, partial [Planctomycetota bacterium]
ALARAAGIPARVTSGLTQHRGAFIGHMWSEVYCGGEWFPLDGTLGDGRVPPDHIALGTSELDDANANDLFVSLVGMLGYLEIDVVDVTP